MAHLFAVFAKVLEQNALPLVRADLVVQVLHMQHDLIFACVRIRR